MPARRLAILGTRGIPARYGGFETFAQEISRRLVQAGIDVTVYCEDGGPDSYEGVRLRYIATQKLGPLSTIVFDLRCLWTARRDYDVVYMLGYGAALFCFLPRLWRREVWINMDGIEWRRSKWSFLGRLWLKSMEWVATRVASRLIVDARGIGEHLAARHRRLPPMTMIPYGVDVLDTPPEPALLEAYRLEPGSYCLIVCRLEPENHVLEIVRGYAGANSEVPLIVVGALQPDSAYCAELQQHASAAVRFIGAVYDQQRLWALRFHSRVYFHGHSVGGTNPSLLEAMAAGNLIVAHDNPFNREVLGDLGEYFRASGDIAPLTERLLGLGAPGRRERVRRVQDRVRRTYPWRRIAEDYLQLLSGG